MRPAQRELDQARLEVERLEGDLTDLHRALAQRPPPPMMIANESDLGILAARKFEREVDLEVLLGSELLPLPVDETTLVLERDHSAQQHVKYSQYLSHDIAVLQAGLEHDLGVQRELSALNRALLAERSRDQSLSHAPLQEVIPPRGANTDLADEHLDHLEADTLALTRQLGSFVRLHFPLPDTGKAEIRPIKELIELLMNAAVEGSGWVRMDDKWWSPQVELLRRAALIETHPEDTKLVRLVDLTI